MTTSDDSRLQFRTDRQWGLRQLADFAESVQALYDLAVLRDRLNRQFVLSDDTDAAISKGLAAIARNWTNRAPRSIRSALDRLDADSLLSPAPDPIQLDELSQPTVLDSAFDAGAKPLHGLAAAMSDSPLRVVQISMASPGVIDLSGSSSWIGQIRETIKDLSYRNSAEAARMGAETRKLSAEARKLEAEAAHAEIALEVAREEFLSRNPPGQPLSNPFFMLLFARALSVVGTAERDGRLVGPPSQNMDDADRRDAASPGPR